MQQWYMVAVIGADRTGIVARITAALFERGCNLGEASMMRLGGNFTVMLMVSHDGDAGDLERLLAPVAAELGLRLHIDRIEGQLHRHPIPDVRITVFGADRSGIVASVTGALAEAGLNILGLESDVGGSDRAPIYIMQIEGTAGHGIEALQAAVAGMSGQGIEIRIEPIETMIG